MKAKRLLAILLSTVLLLGLAPAAMLGANAQVCPFSLPGDVFAPESVYLRPGGTEIYYVMTKQNLGAYLPREGNPMEAVLGINIFDISLQSPLMISYYTVDKNGVPANGIVNSVTLAPGESQATILPPPGPAVGGVPAPAAPVEFVTSLWSPGGGRFALQAASPNTEGAIVWVFSFFYCGQTYETYAVTWIHPTPTTQAGVAAMLGYTCRKGLLNFEYSLRFASYTFMTGIHGASGGNSTSRFYGSAGPGANALEVCPNLSMGGLGSYGWSTNDAANRGVYGGRNAGNGNMYVPVSPGGWMGSGGHGREIWGNDQFWSSVPGGVWRMKGPAVENAEISIGDNGSTTNQHMFNAWDLMNTANGGIPRANIAIDISRVNSYTQIPFLSVAAMYLDWRSNNNDGIQTLKLENFREIPNGAGTWPGGPLVERFRQPMTPPGGLIFNMGNNPRMDLDYYGPTAVSGLLPAQSGMVSGAAGVRQEHLMMFDWTARPAAFGGQSPDEGSISMYMYLDTDLVNKANLRQSYFANINNFYALDCYDPETYYNGYVIPLVQQGVELGRVMKDECISAWEWQQQIDSLSMPLTPMPPSIVTVNFVDFNGTAQVVRPVDVAIPYGQTQVTVTPPAQNTYTGWDTNGWTDAPAAEAAPLSTITVTLGGPNVFFGLYKKDLTVSYNPNGGSPQPPAQTAQQRVNSYNINQISYPQITIYDGPFAHPTFDFVEWVDTKTGDEYYPGQIILLAKSMTLLATWTARSYTVTYDFATNGGNGVDKTSATVYQGQPLDLSVQAYKNNNWSFLGWATPNSTTVLTTPPIMGTTPVTLYAVFSKTLTATFKDSAGTSTDAVTIYNSATQGAVSAPAQSNLAGWTNNGWAKNDTAATAAPVSSYTIDSDTNFYGLYKKELTLSYDTMGGSTAPTAQKSDQRVNSNNLSNIANPTFNLNATEPTLTGYDFMGWAEGSPSGTLYAAGDPITIGADTTMFAVWQLQWVNVTGVSLEMLGWVQNETDSYGFSDDRIWLYADVEPANANDKSVGWASNDTAVAKIHPLSEYTGTQLPDFTGYDTSRITLVKTYGYGTADITATTVEGNFKAIGRITHSQTKTSIKLNPVDVGGPLNASIPLDIPVLMDGIDNDNAVWTSSDPTVATVDENGVVTTHAEGTAVITATVQIGPRGSVTAQYEVTVGGGGERKPVKFDASAFRVDYKKGLQLSFSGDNTGYTWESSNSSIKVDQNGFVTSAKSFFKLPSATITVKDANGIVVATCKVNVQPTFLQWLLIVCLAGWIWY